MFCENCGRQLLDGEVCTCTQQTPVTSEQPAPAPQAPEAPQPQLYQPQPQPVYQPTPEPAPAPAPAPTPVYQQPAPAPAPQPAYQQPAPAPAPQPAYQQPAPAPAYQPAYQPVQPSAYTPVSKPVAEKPASYGKPRYNLMAQLLSSPVILVFGILYAVSILFQLISVASSFSLLSVFTLILVLLDSLIAVGAIICWVSAKGYISKSTPISTVGLTMASGLLKAYGIVYIVLCSILTLLVLISCGASGSAYPLITLIIPVALVFFKVAYYFSLSNALKAVRHEISIHYYGNGISLYPVVIKCINTVFQVIGFIFTIIFLFAASSIVNSLSSNGLLRELRRSIGREYYDMIMDFLLPSSGAVAVTVITSLVGLAISVLAIVILIKARQAKAQTYMMKE